MPANSPAQAFPYPITTDDPDVPDDMMKLAKAIEKRVVGVYTSTSDRDTKTASAGVEEGMFAFTKDTDKFWYYNGSSWTQMTYPTVTSGTTVPADATGANGDVFFKIS